MGSKKKDLEIIYNLQWKNKSANGGDKANIIGMYDIPATTLNWEIFKSYLLKNSGTVGDDVKVSYITDSNREFAIESQSDFQIALYAFRRKARMGDIVNLKLDRISDQPTHKNIRHSNDVETQFDNEGASLVSTCCIADNPPDWFIKYMNQFKKSIVEELTATVSGILSNVKLHTANQAPCYHGRKSKGECSKRLRKIPPFGEPSHETKDLIKSLRLEGKLERKLEKLEHKTKKIRDKKIALYTLKSSDSDAGPSGSKHRHSRPCENDDGLPEMDAIPVNTQLTVPHMLGGEIYLHQWEVMNTGKLPWTSKTSLMFTWGSKALTPLDTIISVPYLKPGETGILAVRLQIPREPGQYESYWHFHHKDRRFGHWLGCQIIVDPFDLKGNKSVLETSFVSELNSAAKNSKANDEGDQYNLDNAVTRYSEILQKSNKLISFNGTTEKKPEEFLNKKESSPKNVLDELVRDISAKVEDMKLQDATDTNCSSDSDNQSVVSLSESNSSRSIPEEFVVVPIPDCFKVDKTPDVVKEDVEVDPNTEKGDNVTDCVQSTSRASTERAKEEIGDKVQKNYDDNNNTEERNQNAAVAVNAVDRVENVASKDSSQKSDDIVVVSLPNEKDQNDADYAYIIVDGHKLPIPKRMIKSEYLQAAESSQKTSNDVTRTNSAASSVEIVNKEEVHECGCDLKATNSPYTKTGIVDSGVTDQSAILENNDFGSHCSAAGSCFSDVNSGLENKSRLFIFPQNCPGYELVQPVPDIPESIDQEVYNWATSGTQYAYSGCDATPLSRTYILASPPTVQPSAGQAEPTLVTNPLNLSTHDRNPFIPNYQQTPPSMRPTAPIPEATASSSENIHVNVTRTEVPSGVQPSEPTIPQTIPENSRSSPQVHVLPEALVSGAVNVASSAINTARSVIKMIVPPQMPVAPNTDVLQPGRWVNGHWVSSNPDTPREANLQALAEMGFWNRDLNATLLARYNDDLSRVVAELIQ